MRTIEFGQGVEQQRLRRSIVAQFVNDTILSTVKRESIFKRLSFSLLITARRLLVWLLDDPPITYKLEGTPILLPLSHDLPLIRARYPLYSKSIVGLAEFMAAKYNDLAMIDIGANVGDTIVMARSCGAFPILGVDGDRTFFKYLEHNVGGWDGVDLRNQFIGSETGTVSASHKSGGGTARLVLESGHDSGVRTVMLSTLLADEPDFLNFRILKIDTDGWDVSIIMAEHEFLRQRQPVIYFEYDPWLFGQARGNGFMVFETLRRSGYVAALCFENTGQYLMHMNLGDEHLLKSMHKYCQNGAVHRYCDICVFAPQDMDVFERLVQWSQWGLHKT